MHKLKLVMPEYESKPEHKLKPAMPEPTSNPDPESGLELHLEKEPESVSESNLKLEEM